MGFSCDRIMRETKPSDRQKLELKMEGREFLVATVKKIVTKCPVNYSLVRYLSCLKMALEKDNCISNLKKVLHLLVSNGKAREQDCDMILNQYSFFLEEIP